jgi:quercetin dioxygenase-like cupin family protein
MRSGFRVQGSGFWVLATVAAYVLVETISVRAQDRPLTVGQPTVEVLVTTELSEVGLPGTSVAQRVTIPPGTKMADHTHSGRTSLLIMVQGALTEVRGIERHEYKTGDVIKVSEGVTHHAENYGTVPAVYIEINTTAKK